jgi:hypothetical protein
MKKLLYERIVRSSFRSQCEQGRSDRDILRVPMSAMTHGRIILEDDLLNAGRVKQEIGVDVSSYSSTIIIECCPLSSWLT